MKRKNNFFVFFRNNFIAGATLLLPLWGVWFFIKFVVNLLNNILLDPIITVLSPYLKNVNPYIVASVVKFIIIFTIMFLITLLGLLVKNFFVRKILSLAEKLLMKIPLINKVYVAMRQISHTFLMNKQGIFDKSVLVEYPHKGKYVLAFITSDATNEIKEKTGKDLISVFVPTTPNPTSGFLIFVPKRDIIMLDMGIEDSFKLIVSFGAVKPDDNHYDM